MRCLLAYAAQWQLLAQIGGQGLSSPVHLRWMYDVLRVLLFDINAIVHPSCVSSYRPFLLEMLQFAATGLLASVLFVCLAVHACMIRRNATAFESGSRPRRGLAALTATLRCVTALLFGLYPLVTTTVLSTLWCTRLSETYARPDSGHWVVRASPQHQCFGREHFVPGVMAAVCGAVFVLGFPLCSFAYLFLARHRWCAPLLHPVVRLTPLGNVHCGGPRGDTSSGTDAAPAPASGTSPTPVKGALVRHAVVVPWLPVRTRNSPA